MKNKELRIGGGLLLAAVLYSKSQQPPAVSGLGRIYDTNQGGRLTPCADGSFSDSQGPGVCSWHGGIKRAGQLTMFANTPAPRRKKTTTDVRRAFDNQKPVNTTTRTTKRKPPTKRTTAPSRRTTPPKPPTSRGTQQRATRLRR